MPSSSSKVVFLLGGLGNQLWLAAYCFYLVENGYSVNLDVSWYQNFSDYLFRAARVKRKFYSDLFSLLVPSVSVKFGLLSLLRLRFICLCYSFFPSSSLGPFLYRQDDKYIDNSFLVSLSSALDCCTSFSIQHKTFLRSKIAIHLRLGDRGLSLSDSELVSLRHKLSLLSPTDSLLLFSDNPEVACSILTSLSFTSFQPAPDYVDDIYTLYAMSICKSRISIRPSTFLDWSEKISDFALI